MEWYADLKIIRVLHNLSLLTLQNSKTFHCYHEKYIVCKTNLSQRDV